MSDNPWQEPHDTSLEAASPHIERALDTPDIPPAREGLPRNFRMRADRHYVDQLAASSADQPVRMLPVSDLYADEHESESDLRPLIESIRAHGVVHPLLVRRRESGFAIVAGRRRLRAARALRLPSVPCLVRDVSETDAAALAAADNVTIRPAADIEASRGLADGRNIVAGHLAKVRGSIDMWSGESGGLNRPALDMLKAHTWRSTVMVQALALIEGVPPPPRRERTIAAIVEEVVDGFAAETSLAGITVRVEARDDLSTSGLNDEEVKAGLAVAVVAMLPLAEQSAARALVVRTASASAGAVALEIGVPGASLPRSIAAAFFDPELVAGRPGGHAAAIAAQAVKALADRHAGTAAIDAADRAWRLTITLARRS